MRKFLAILALGLWLITPSYAAWNATKPADNEKLKDTPALLRSNFAAIATGTDAALCVTNAKMCAGAAVGDDKLAQITSAAKVHGSALTGLSSIPSSANGQIPIANGGTGASTAANALTALLPTQTGNSGKSLVTDASSASWGYPTSLTIASSATGDILYYNGSVWTRLAAGTDGKFLKAKGAAAPEWNDVFNTSSGHDHDGSDSKKVLATNIDTTGLSSGTGYYVYNNSGSLATSTFTSPALTFVGTQDLTGGSGATWSSLSTGYTYLVVWQLKGHASETTQVRICINGSAWNDESESTGWTGEQNNPSGYTCFYSDTNVAALGRGFGYTYIFNNADDISRSQMISTFVNSATGSTGYWNVDSNQDFTTIRFYANQTIPAGRVTLYRLSDS